MYCSWCDRYHAGRCPALARRKYTAPVDAPRYRHMIGTAGTWQLIAPKEQRNALWQRGFGPFLFPTYWGADHHHWGDQH